MYLWLMLVITSVVDDACEMQIVLLVLMLILLERSICVIDAC